MINWSVSQGLFHTAQTEFAARIMTIAPAFDYSTRDQQERCVCAQTNDGGVDGRVREQTQGQAGRGQFDNSFSIAQQRRSMAGVCVAESSKLFVIAGEEGRAGMHSFGDFNQVAVDIQTEFGHGVGFIDIGLRKQFRAKAAKGLLHGREDSAVSLAQAGKIQKAEQNSFRADAK